MTRRIRTGLLVSLLATYSVGLPTFSLADDAGAASGTHTDWAIAPEPKVSSKRGLVVRERTVLQRDLELPGGTVLPAGTILPAGTVLPAGVPLPGTAQHRQGAPVDEPLRQSRPALRRQEQPMADPAAPSFDSPETSDGVPYISGGIGYSERDDMNRVKSKYNLRMLFAEQGSGSYLSDVKVQIADGSGPTLLSAMSKGPWFYANVTPGTYMLTVEYEGKVQTRQIKVPDSGAAQADFYWVP